MSLVPQTMRPKNKGKGCGLLVVANSPLTPIELGAVIGYDQRGGIILSPILKGLSGCSVKKKEREQSPSR